MLQFKSNDDEHVIIYNPITENKWFSIDFHDRVFSIFNYFSGEYLIERNF